MAGPLAIKDIWRVMKDVDLDAIRAQAHMPFEMLIVSDDGRDAEALAGMMTAEAPATADEVHPWLHVISARAGVPANLPSPEIAIIVSRHVKLPSATEAVRDHLTAHRIPALTVIVGTRASAAHIAHRNEMRRIPIDAIDVEARGAIAEALVASIRAEARISLARGFAWARNAVFLATVDETARANAGYAFTTGLAETVPVLSAPLALGDMLVLTKNQLIMSYRIALSAGRDGDPKALVGEIIGVLGGGLLFRQAARSLVGLIPIVGLVPKVAIAYGGTYAIGRAMMAWATEGRAVTADAVKKYASEGLEQGRRVARSLAAGTKASASMGTRVRNWISRKRPTS